MAELAQKIAALLPQAEGNPTAMLHVARMMRKDGRPEEGLALCRRAQALSPNNARLTAETDKFLSEDVPSWHFVMLHDHARNAAYDAALRRAMPPGSRVLEIGTGSGLLAMMAARAGAVEVVTCEINPTIAQMATEIVARNGYADRVRVIAKHSDKLDVEADLGGRVDILVSEIVNGDLLGEGVLPAHERAVRDLLKPGGRVIPASGRIRVALAEDSRDQMRLGMVDGFDLSLFNQAAPRARQSRVGNERLTLQSAPADLFAFDFGSGRFCTPGKASAICCATGGQVNGIAQWIALEMDEETVYENRPAHGATSCWPVLFHPLRQPINTLPGQEIRICGSHDRQRVSVWCDV